MKAIITRNPHESFSFSRRYFTWKKKSDDNDNDDDDLQDHQILTLHPSLINSDQSTNNFPSLPRSRSVRTPRKPSSKLHPISRLRAALIGRPRPHSTLIGTLFGHRRGHVHFAFQEGFNQVPVFLVQLATPTSLLVKEMASGQVRIALECEKKALKIKGFKLVEEPIWRTYCNGKKCGYAMRKECGPEERKVLEAIGPISMGAGVLPGAGGAAEAADGEMMYMRAKFERVVGSKDSEAFYMMNPDGNGGPELSIYLLRV